MAEQHILQVSELTKKVKFMLESELNTVWLCGEISNFIAASSGHWYLSLKDNKSQVKCAMFKGNNRRVRFSEQQLPRNGQQVLVRAKVSLYEPRGDFQLILEMMEDAGEGLLRQQYEQLKNKLNAQGLFAQQFKQPIPKHINCVGIITSPTGAAVKDILSVLKRRNPSITAIIYPAMVQGQQAKFDIENAIDIANQREECDVLIVGRGGGSLEDLWSFNEEEVVNAIFHSRIPVISAVGHEVDTTLADYVADLRAPTPSAAAELVSLEVNEYADKLLSLTKRMRQNIQHRFNSDKQRVLTLNHRLSQVHPEQRLQIHQQKADELNMRLAKAIKLKMMMVKALPQQLAERLVHLSPLANIKKQQTSLLQLHSRLEYNTQRVLQSKQKQFVHKIEQLQLVSPLATIARGYSISRDQHGNIIKSSKAVSINDEVSIQLSDGIIEATVSKIKA